MDQEIEQFESWWDSEWDTKDNPYYGELLRYAFQAWNAGRKDMDQRIKEAIEAEREACAKVCDALINTDYLEWEDSSYWDQGVERCAAAIRARGQG